MQKTENQDLITAEMERLLIGKDTTVCNANFDFLVKLKENSPVYKELASRYWDAKAAHDNTEQISEPKKLENIISGVRKLNTVKLAIFAHYAQEIEKYGEKAIVTQC